MLRVARWSSGHRRTVIALWVLVLFGALGVSRTVGNHFYNSITLPGTDSQRATDLLKSRFPMQAGDADQIVFHSRTGVLDRPALRDSIAQALLRVARLPHVTAVISPYASRRSISRDGTIGFATVHFDERSDALPVAAVKRVVAVAESARSTRLQVELGGAAIEETQRPTLGAATAIGIGAAVVV